MTRAATAAAWLLRAVAIVLFLTSLHTLYVAGSIALSHPHQIDREEGFLLNQAVLLRSSETIYGDLSDYPFLVGNYTPIFPALMAVFTDPGDPQLAPGRWINFASLIVIILVISTLNYLSVKQFFCIPILMGILLTSYNVKYWLPFARVDFLAQAFAIVALALVIQFKQRWVLALAGLLFALAFFTKQTQVVAPVLAFGYLLAKRDWRGAGLLAGVGIAAGLIAGGALLIATQGQFWRHTVTFNQNEFAWDRVVLNARHLWRFDWCWLLALGVLAALQWSTWRDWIWAAAFTGLAAAMAITIGKVGSDVNYLIELEIAAVMWLSLMLGKELAAPRLLTFAPALLLAAHAALLFAMPNRAILFQQPPTSEWNVEPAELQELLAAHPGDVLTEDAVVALRAGRQVLYQPFIMTQLAAQGLWDPAPLLADLKRARFSAIITYDPLEGQGPTDGFSAEARSLINDRYRLAGSFWFYPGKQRHLYVRQ